MLTSHALYSTRFRRLAVCQVAPGAGSLNAIIALRDEMFTPGRADNVLSPLNIELLKNILESS